MDGNERRKILCEYIANSDLPLSATTLAKHLQVSRQLIVGDIALLRAAGKAILATPRGYKMSEQQPSNRFTIACIHTADKTCDELYTIVDAGGVILDVIVEHPIYGQLCGQLNLHSRADVNDFIEKSIHSDIQLLSSLTDGIHLHNIQCGNEAIKEMIINLLNKKGYLLKNTD